MPALIPIMLDDELSANFRFNINRIAEWISEQLSVFPDEVLYVVSVLVLGFITIKLIKILHRCIL